MLRLRGTCSSAFAQRTHRNIPYGEPRLTHRLLRRAIPPQSILTPYLCCSPRFMKHYTSSGWSTIIIISGSTLLPSLTELELTDCQQRRGAAMLRSSSGGIESKDRQAQPILRRTMSDCASDYMDEFCNNANAFGRDDVSSTHPPRSSFLNGIRAFLLFFLPSFPAGPPRIGLG